MTDSDNFRRVISIHDVERSVVGLPVISTSFVVVVATIAFTTPTLGCGATGASDG